MWCREALDWLTAMIYLCSGMWHAQQDPKITEPILDLRAEAMVVAAGDFKGTGNQTADQSTKKNSTTWKSGAVGTPERTLTSALPLRRRLLYTTELLERVSSFALYRKSIGMSTWNLNVRLSLGIIKFFQKRLAYWKTMCYTGYK